MFHRRLTLLMGLMVVGAVVLFGQLVRLTVVEGADRRREAESRLLIHNWTPTHRGRILDRKGRVLALDRPSFDIAVEYKVMTGAWAFEEAAREARRQNRAQWQELSPAARREAIDDLLPVYQQRLNDMWQRLASISGSPPAELEANRTTIIERVNRMASSIWSRRLARDREQALVEQRETTLELADVARPIREQTETHVLLSDVDDTVAFEARRLAAELPGVHVQDGARREYPFERVDVTIDRSSFPGPLKSDTPMRAQAVGVETHLVGWMRKKVTREDVKRRPLRDPATGEIDRGHYQTGDAVGSSGIERALEHQLRGLRGRDITHLDTGKLEVIAPSAGADVKLTIDIALQARLAAIFDPAFGLAQVQPWHESSPRIGSPLLGGAVVLDIQSGDVLAMVSSPSFTREEMRERPERLIHDDLRFPLVNRPLSRPYQPGSIVKPLVLVEAVTRGVHALTHPIECAGHYFPNKPDGFRCWIYRERFSFATHSQQVEGPLYAPDAIARSCNIYFYTLGDALGAAGVERFYRSLGVGHRYETGVPGANAGFVGRLEGTPIERNEAIFMGIGQGPVSWTPLHAANAFATLARRGVRLEPRVVASLEREPVDLGWDQGAIEYALDGLHLGVTQRYGTGHHIRIHGVEEPIFNAPGIRVAGKTGTAQAQPLKIDPEGKLAGLPGVVRDPKTDPLPEHAWTVVLAGPEDSKYRYAIAVVVEYAGSGGRFAGPIANQAIHALIAEGYLPGAASAEQSP